MNFLVSFFVAICLSLTVSHADAATYVQLEDALIYDMLSRLEAEGVITSGLLNRKPISRAEARRLLQEAETRSESRSAYVRSVVRSLRERLGELSNGSIETLYVNYTYTNSEPHTLQYGESAWNQQIFNYNHNGDLNARGSNLRTGFFARLDDWGPLSIGVNPEFRFPDHAFKEDSFVTRKAYAVLGLGSWDVVIGQDSQWWGPGYHGALLLSNNAEPFTMLKVTNPAPVRFPWILEQLGPSGFTFFVTNLEKARGISEPYLYGMRLDFKPSPYFEIGLQKTALLGGRQGRPEDVNTWIDSLYGAADVENCSENCNAGDPGDQRAGFDLKITVPWEVQPIQIYMEAAGEDEQNNLPAHRAVVFGLYLPRLGSAQFGFRAEYAKTREAWYRHYLYTSYTYNENIIGHHIGTGARDWVIELSHLMPQKNGRVFISYDNEEQYIFIPGPRQVLHGISTGAILSLSKQTGLKAEYSRGWLRNRGNEPRPTERPEALSAEISYAF